MREVQMLKFAIFITVLVAMAFTFTGCQMVEGFGKDLQSAGEGTQKTAQHFIKE